MRSKCAWHTLKVSYSWDEYEVYEKKGRVTESKLHNREWRNWLFQFINFPMRKSNKNVIGNIRMHKLCKKINFEKKMKKPQENMIII